MANKPYAAYQLHTQQPIVNDDGSVTQDFVPYGEPIIGYQQAIEKIAQDYGKSYGKAGFLRAVQTGKPLQIGKHRILVTPDESTTRAEINGLSKDLEQNNVHAVAIFANTDPNDKTQTTTIIDHTSGKPVVEKYSNATDAKNALLEHPVVGNLVSHKDMNPFGGTNMRKLYGTNPPPSKKDD